jgi:D-alanyl-D-alanine carboxypeptidase
VAARLQGILASYLATSGTPSISAAVIVPGVGAWQGAVGTASRLDDEGATPDTVYALGSITKTYVAALVMLLAEEGRFSLDDLAADHLGALAGPKANGATIRQLLGHRSGVFNYTNDPRAFEDKPWTFAELLDLIGEPTFEPGEQFEYSNSNYLLLGELVEYVTAGPITRPLHERLLDPLGLSHTFYGPIEKTGGPLAHGYTTEGGMELDGYDDSGVLPTENLASAARSAGGMSATAADVARWMSSLYSGQVLSDESLNEMLDFSASGSYGLGVGLTFLRSGRTAVGHDGGIPGFISVGNYDRQSGVVVVVLSNGMELDMFGIQDDLFNAASDLTP